MFKERAPLAFYIFALSLLAFSSTLAYQLAFKGLEDRENDAKVVNIAGRQRMLSQRIAKVCLELQQDSLPQNARSALYQSLEKSLAEWQQARFQLRGLTPIGDFTVKNSNAIEIQFDGIEAPFQVIQHAAQSIINSPDKQIHAAISEILKQEPLFLNGMETIVLQYQKESAANMKQLGQLETSIWIFTLFLLSLEFCFIFIPLNRRISRNLEEKYTQNQLLLEKQDALEKSLDLMQRMQQNLLEAEKLATLGETVGIITHEINTPIGIAVTAASSLQEFTDQFVRDFEQQQLRKSNLEAYVDHAREGSMLVLKNLEKAAKLLQDFKNVAVRQLSGQKEHFDLCELITQVANTLGPYFKNTELALTLNLPHKLEIDSHPGVFAQIVMNLVSNSLRHGYPTQPQKGTMTLQLSEQNDVLCLIYTDDGVGISPDLLPHIFEPFFSTGKQKGGSGLGLSIVQHLVVKQLGGIIRCESDLNAGVRFEIRLPKDFSAESPAEFGSNYQKIT